jgi:hypothetical protein
MSTLSPQHTSFRGGQRLVFDYAGLFEVLLVLAVLLGLTDNLHRGERRKGELLQQACNAVG